LCNLGLLFRIFGIAIALSFCSTGHVELNSSVALGPFPVQPTPEGVTGHLAYNAGKVVGQLEHFRDAQGNTVDTNTTDDSRERPKVQQITIRDTQGPNLSTSWRLSFGFWVNS
jgi:hypothetical protein